jgi:NDP-sugar pyrophosphorylase family protein
MQTQQAVILLGGKGTRLSALYPDIPKALIPVAGKPFLRRQIDWLFNNGILSISLAAGYRGGQISEWLRQQNYGKEIRVSIEPQALGTGGGLKYLENMTSGPTFWALNGDSLLPNLNFSLMEKHHRQSGAWATLAVTTIEDAGRYGTILFDRNDKITSFNEKGESGRGWINAGVYLIEPRLLTVIEPNQPVSIEHEVFPRLVPQGKLSVFRSDPPLLDMGTPEGLAVMENYLCIQGQT